MKSIPAQVYYVLTQQTIQPGWKVGWIALQGLKIRLACLFRTPGVWTRIVTGGDNFTVLDYAGFATCGAAMSYFIDVKIPCNVQVYTHQFHIHGFNNSLFYGDAVIRRHMERRRRRTNDKRRKVYFITRYASRDTRYERQTTLRALWLFFLTLLLKKCGVQHDCWYCLLLALPACSL